MESISQRIFSRNILSVRHGFCNLETPKMSLLQDNFIVVYSYLYFSRAPGHSRRFKMASGLCVERRAYYTYYAPTDSGVGGVHRITRRALMMVSHLLR